MSRRTVSRGRAPRGSTGGSADGFTVAECLVALSIFSVAALALAVGFAHHLAANTRAEVKAGAVRLAAEVLDSLRGFDPSALPVSGLVRSDGAATTVPEARTFGTRRYEVTTAVDDFLGTTRTATLRNLDVRVSYRGAEVYRVATTFVRLN